jgi:hypothetical protein
MAQCYDAFNPGPDESVYDLYLATSSHKIVWLLVGIAALTTILLSVQLNFKHSSNYTRPSQQRYIMRIVFTLPFYAITSWLSYTFYRVSVFYDLFRETYEAFAIACLFILFANYVGDKPKTQRAVFLQSADERSNKLLFPLKNRVDVTNHNFLNFLKYGVLQFVIIKPICFFVAMVLYTQKLYCPENYEPRNNANLWLTIVSTTSMVIALYTLLTFYRLMQEDLKPHRALSKFVGLKVFIALIVLQRIIATALATHSVMGENDVWTAENLATGLNNILITCETVVFALYYRHAFTYRPYVINTPIKDKHWWSGFVDAINPMDLIKEIGHAFTNLYGLAAGKKEPSSRPGRGRVGPSNIAGVAMQGELDSIENWEESNEIMEEKLVMDHVDGRQMYTHAYRVDLGGLMDNPTV